VKKHIFPRNYHLADCKESAQHSAYIELHRLSDIFDVLLKDEKSDLNSLHCQISDRLENGHPQFHTLQ